MQINGKKLLYPIIQGGMGIKISMKRLAVACMREGIAATISCAQPGYSDSVEYRNNVTESNINALKEQIDFIRSSDPKGIVGVNLMHALREYASYATFLSTCDIDYVVCGAGLPVDLPKYFIDSKVKLAFIVSSGRACKILLRKWINKHNFTPEFIVVEGPLAGGHLGFSKEEMANKTYKSLDEIVVEVLDVVKDFDVTIPVVAAGGISSGTEIDHFIELGCDGVQIATPFIATEECDAAIEYKQKIIDTKEEDIVIINSPAGLPGRAVRNTLTETILTKNLIAKHCTRCLRGCTVVDIPFCISERLGNACLGDVENGLVFTGAKGYLLDSIITVKELVRRLMSTSKLGGYNG